VWLRFESAVGVTATFDSTLTSFADGQEFVMTQYGAGTLTIQVSGTYVRQSPTGNYTTRAQYSTIFAKYYVTDKVFILGGDLT
jgi:hypothetical protein